MQVSDMILSEPLRSMMYAPLKQPADALREDPGDIISPEIKRKERPSRVSVIMAGRRLPDIPELGVNFVVRPSPSRRHTVVEKPVSLPTPPIMFTDPVFKPIRETPNPVYLPEPIGFPNPVGFPLPEIPEVDMVKGGDDDEDSSMLFSDPEDWMDIETEAVGKNGMNFMNFILLKLF